jgi:hypothetical protein
MSVFPVSGRALVASAAAVALGVAPLATPGSAAAVDRPENRAEAFQSGEVRNYRIPSAFVAGADWGLTVDTIYMLAATGGRPVQVRRMGRVLANNAHKYTRVTFGDTTYRAAGATAKVLIAAKVVDRPARDYGGVDYRKRLSNFIVDRGPDAGRLSDNNSDGSDFSSTLTQALGVIAFSRSGGAPQRVVRHLLEQQCSNGGFTQAMTTGQTCAEAGGSPSVDSTAYAIQAMYAARKQGDAQVPVGRIRRAVAWLLGAQRDNGSFGSDRSIPTANANSTGLAAQALADAGRDAAVRRARQFMTTLQVTRGDAGQARRVIGAIAYDRASLRAARQDGTIDRDQFRRATAQGAFAFAPKPLRTLSTR